MTFLKVNKLTMKLSDALFNFVPTSPEYNCVQQVSMDIREYSNIYTLYVGMASGKNIFPYISVASDVLKSLVKHIPFDIECFHESVTWEKVISSNGYV